jgi:uncharacterized protein
MRRASSSRSARRSRKCSVWHADLDGVSAHRDASRHLRARGNLVPDAHVATILFQNGVRTLYPSDRDFRKFESLDVRDPFA